MCGALHNRMLQAMVMVMMMMMTDKEFLISAKNAK
jgi:hypothetical protein